MTVALPSPDRIKRMSVDPAFDVRSANLGDGFKRIAVGGLNSVVETYKVTWSPEVAADAVVIYDALKATLGVEEITFTPPDRVVEETFTLKSLSRRSLGSLNEVVEATLEQRFLP